MQSLEEYKFAKRKRRKTNRVPICQVVIGTKSSGKIRRKLFANWDDAHEYADFWLEKNSDHRTYSVSVESL